MPADQIPARAATAIEAALAAIDGRPVAEDDPAARRAAVVIRAIQAQAQARSHRPGAG